MTDEQHAEECAKKLAAIAATARELCHVNAQLLILNRALQLTNAKRELDDELNQLMTEFHELTNKYEQPKYPRRTGRPTRRRAR
jgi:hypothetical protein